MCWKRTGDNRTRIPTATGSITSACMWTISERRRARARRAVSQPPPPVDLSKLSGNTLYFEKKLELAGVKFDLSGHGWATKREK